MRGWALRSGFTLFEVILALAIVGGAVAVISEIVWSGMENARMTQEFVQAELLAQSVMAEIVAGIRPLETTQDNAFEDDSGLEDPEQWLYSVETRSLEAEGLVEARVTVRANSDKPRSVKYSLVRWILVAEDSESSSAQTTE